MTNQDAIYGRKQRWASFLSQDKAVKNVFLIHYDEGEIPSVLFHPDKKKERLEWAWNMYNKMMEHSDWLMDDRVPCLNGLCLFYRDRNICPGVRL